MPQILKSSAWPRMRRHPAGERYSDCKARFNFVAAGRRSGKTLRLKAKVIRAAAVGTAFADPRFFLCAPTRDQAKRIFWNDLKAMIPRAIQESVSESELMIRISNGSCIYVVGLDKPARIEGPPWDGGGITEIANVKKGAWEENIRPALSDRNGWCDLEGVPEGRNHAYALAREAEAEQDELLQLSEWGYHHWKSAEVLPATEIESAKRMLDPLTFKQEFEADFVSFQGSAYYSFASNVHAEHRLRYNDRRALILSLDFNVAPGVAVIGQEQTLPNGEMGTGWIDEVWIERDSNTLKVMDKFLERYANHRGILQLHGDASGGAKGSAKVAGSDWELALQKLKPVFGGRLKAEYPRANPSERSRLNAVNSRLCSALGIVRMMVDPVGCPHLSIDFEGVDLDDQGAIDKDSDKSLTHLCFRGDTLVRTPAGTQRIDSIPERGLVKGWDGRWVAYEDARLTVPDAEMVAVNIQGYCDAYCTPEHRWWASGRWVCAKDLTGLRLRNWMQLAPAVPSGTPRNGTVLRVLPAPQVDAFCLRVPTDGCFALADGWIVGNSDAAGYYVSKVFPVYEGSVSVSPLGL